MCPFSIKEMTQMEIIFSSSVIRSIHSDMQDIKCDYSGNTDSITSDSFEWLYKSLLRASVKVRNNLDEFMDTVLKSDKHIMQNYIEGVDEHIPNAKLSVTQESYKPLYIGLVSINIRLERTLTIIPPSDQE